MSIESVAVVGCGLMGCGFAEAMATAGVPVKAIKATGGDLERARSRVRRSVDRRVDKGKLTVEERDAILGRITFTDDISAVSDCGLVLESGIEDLPSKIRLLGEIESHMTNGAILATNTSSLLLAKLKERLRRPEQFLGLHFFNPVPAMRLVELAPTEETAPGVVDAARNLCHAVGKTPIEIAASPGYVVNRLLVPYLLQAIETVESGVAGPQEIDEAMKLGAGHPMGPLALADLIGLDVVLAMARTLQGELHDNRYRAPSLLRRLVVAGHLGRKASLGIYDYRGERPVVNPAVHLAPASPTIETAAE